MSVAQKSAEFEGKPYKWYLMDALRVLKPPENLTVSEWADKYRILSPKDSASPGRWPTVCAPPSASSPANPPWNGTAPR